MLHDIEHGKRGYALPVRRQLIYCPAVIGSRNRLHPFRLKFGKIFHGMCAALRSQKLNHHFRQLAVIKCIAPVRRDLLQRFGQRRILEHVAQLRVYAARRVGFRVARLLQQLLGYPIVRILLGERKPILGIKNGRCEQLRKRQTAKAAAQRVPPATQPGTVIVCTLIGSSLLMLWAFR